MKGLKIILLLFVTGFFSTTSGQDVTQPLPPVLDRVTVDPSTGNSILFWLPGGSPDVGSYVIYTFSNNLATARDTVESPFLTNYIYSGSAARYESEAYVVAAMDSSNNISPLSNSLGTIFLSVVNDTCNGMIHLSWTPYTNIAHPATDYIIYMSVNSADADTLRKISISLTSFDLVGYQPDLEYCFFITAVNNNEELSSSNMQCIASGSEGPPSWTQVDAVLVNNGAITVIASYDPDSDIEKFTVERSSGGAAPWEVVGSKNGAGGSVSVSSTGIDTMKINLYRVSAVNNCDQTIVASEAIRNIVLSSEVKGDNVYLRWNNPFPGENANFTLWRNSGSGYEEVYSGLTDTLLTESYRAFFQQVTTGEVLYYITAQRDASPALMTSSRSSTSSINPVINIFVANAFTPDDNGLNDTFAPLLSFIPLKYDFRVTSRQGVILFRTTSHGTTWDGKHNGTPLPEGVYLWTIRLTTPSGKVIERSGTVTILR